MSFNTIFISKNRIKTSRHTNEYKITNVFIELSHSLSLARCDLSPSPACFRKSDVAISTSLSDTASRDNLTAEQITLHSIVSLKERFPLRPAKENRSATEGQIRRRRSRRVASRQLSPPTRASCLTCKENARCTEL